MIQYDANLIAILSSDVVPDAETRIELTPWDGGRVSWSTGSQLTSDGSTLTHRGAEFLARSSVLTRDALVGLWEALLGPLPLGWREEVTELVASRYDADGRLVAHLALLWRRMSEDVTITLATRAQVYSVLGLTQYAEVVE